MTNIRGLRNYNAKGKSAASMGVIDVARQRGGLKEYDTSRDTNGEGVGGPQVALLYRSMVGLVLNFLVLRCDAL